MAEYWLPKPHLSASQIGSFDFCKRSYYYQSIEGIRTSGASGFVGGVAHHALQFLYWYRKRYGDFPSLSTVQEVFSRRFERTRHRVDDWEGYDPTYLINTGRIFLQHHMKHISFQMNPVAIEENLEIEIDGIKIKGFIDLQTANVVWDHKFRFKTMPYGKYNPAKDLQLGLYAIATGKTKVGYLLHHLDKDGSTPVVAMRYAERTEEDLQAVREKVVDTARQIDGCHSAGDFPRNFKNRCSSKSGWKCAFYDKCWGATQEAETQRIYERLTGPALQPEHSDTPEDREAEKLLELWNA